MADSIDRSRYRNPDITVGYVKSKPDYRYIVGSEVDEVHFEIAKWIYDCAQEQHLEEREDYGTLSDLILSSDEECILEAIVNEKALTLPPKIKKENDVEIVDIEKKPLKCVDDVEKKPAKHVYDVEKGPVKHVEDVEKKPVKHEKKAHIESSTLGASFSHMDIDEDKAEKTKKIKIKKERRRSGSSSSSDRAGSSVRRHKSPPASYKRHSPPSRKRRSPSPVYKRRSPSPVYKRRSPSPVYKRRSNSPVCKRRSGSPDHKRGSHSPLHKQRSHSPAHSRRSISPNHRRKHHSPSSRDRVVAYSPSPSPEPLSDVKVKQEYGPKQEYVKEEFVKQEIIKQEYAMPIKTEFNGPPEHLHGSWHCGVCNITMNSELVYNTHINGKRHRKNIKTKNAPQAAQGASIPATVISEDRTKYPKPPLGVIRKRVYKMAEIQGILETKIMTPCPGLNFVIEIQGISAVQYYCSLCDSTCSSNSIIPHLTGFKHMLNTVKQFKPGTYERIQHEPKWKIEKEMKTLLHTYQQQHGMGRMAVETEELDSNAAPFNNPIHPPRDYRDIPSTSRGFAREESDESFSERYQSSTLPDMTVSDFFCRFCQSHMNSLQMWEAHIRGKRHLANLKKMPGDKPSKTKTVMVAGKTAHIIDRIKHERPLGEPFVGLKEVRETEIKDTNAYSYQCFLCGSCHTQMDILEHLMSLKHRTKYLDHVDFPGREVLDGMSDSMASSLVRDMCRQVEAEEGMGKPEVHVDKNSLLKY